MIAVSFLFASGWKMAVEVKRSDFNSSCPSGDPQSGGVTIAGCAEITDLFVERGAQDDGLAHSDGLSYLVFTLPCARITFSPSIPLKQQPWFAFDR